MVITNDGVTILKEMDIEHPAAKMMVEIAKTQDAEVGDGTTTAVVLAGELLKQAEGLLDQEIHPTVIAAGYRAASDKSLEILKTIATDVSVKDTEFLKKIAITSMTGKGSGTARDQLASLAVQAVEAVVDEDGSVDTDNITVEKKVGGGITDSELVHGMVIDKDRLHPNMPKKVTGAKIALLNAAIEIEKTEVDAKIEITSPDQLQACLDQEESMLKGMVDTIKSTGANVVFCQKGIDDLAQVQLEGGDGLVKFVKIPNLHLDFHQVVRTFGGPSYRLGNAARHHNMVFFDKNPVKQRVAMIGSASVNNGALFQYSPHGRGFPGITDIAG